MGRQTTMFMPTQERTLNKEAMGTNIRKIIEFFSLHNYNQEISVAVLRDMRDYDFESIVKFLLRLIDPNIRIENGIKEDFPRIMQMLGYRCVFSLGIVAIRLSSKRVR